ncbi:hypothetical protein CANARDRAFT_27861 [[Candida] arabinofermentans NRRL YB-2248]|uniref:DUF1479-domain-containing protein n=1 Tax=[Candida] arabinofermentans NRRL YB-2248 TaxID=983967 RepID=A0A1E4T251_9ASCO|nr:hypothetical protein CANARDRAFT_27861 [[Candida] arabinofermentans NRRL YB-2248]
MMPLTTSATAVTVQEAQCPVNVLKLQNFPRADLSKVSVKAEGDISSVFSSLEDGEINSSTLPLTYAAIKKRLVTDPQAFKASWLKLKKRLADEIEKISKEGPAIIPSVEFSELQTMSNEKRKEVLKRGCVVVRNVIPRDEARSYKFELEEYIKNNPQTAGFPNNAKVVYELYWSKPQIKARSNPRLIKTLNFMNKLWHADDATEICLDENLSYADRLRIRNPGDRLFTLGPHSDAGSIERWEDENYSKCYKDIWDGKWEDYDAYNATHRVDANSSLYDSQGNCTMFRTFQGWVSMSEIHPGEGTIQFAPLIKEVTAYLLMNPFFKANNEIDLDSSTFPGAVPSKAQEYSPTMHPELQLDKIMTPAPTVYPGDMVFWHCDLIHAVDPECSEIMDSSVMYIPSTPVCKNNTEYSFIQREAFLRKLVAPDFPGFPTSVGESKHIGCAEPSDVERSGGLPALRNFALEALECKVDYSKGAKEAIISFNKLLFGD